MKSRPTECDDSRLAILLSESERSDDYRRLASHVEHCAHCRDQLTALAADRQTWEDVTTLLTNFDATADADGNELASLLSQNFLAPPSHPEMLGRLGRYEIEKVIGSGGMGVVLKAHDTELNRPVAIKVLASFRRWLRNRKRWVVGSAMAVVGIAGAVLGLNGVVEFGSIGEIRSPIAGLDSSTRLARDDSSTALADVLALGVIPTQEFDSEIVAVESELRHVEAANSEHASFFMHSELDHQHAELVALQLRLSQMEEPQFLSPLSQGER